MSLSGPKSSRRTDPNRDRRRTFHLRQSAVSSSRGMGTRGSDTETSVQSEHTASRAIPNLGDAVPLGETVEETAQLRVVH